MYLNANAIPSMTSLFVVVSEDLISRQTVWLADDSATHMVDLGDRAKK